MTPCYFAPFSDAPCSGRLDPCHILSQRVLKRQHSLANPRIPPAWFCPSPLTGTNLTDILADRRNIVAGCRAHHHAADQRFLDFPIPDEAREFASEYDLDHHLPAVGLERVTSGPGFPE